MEEALKAMAAINPENISQDFRPLFVIYKDGTIHRFIGTQTVPPSVDPTTGVESRDVVVQDGGAWVRLYMPKVNTHDGSRRLPVLVYFHGGAFSNESAGSPTYHSYLNKLACKANVIVVSVDYRRAPENPLPAAYDDSWAAVEWVENGLDLWIRDRADLARVFLGGDSAGANIAHHMGKRLGKGYGKGKMKLKGVLLVHPFFWGKDRIGSEEDKIRKLPGPNLSDKLWEMVCPGTSGSDDPLINPGMDPELGDLGGEKVMVCVAEGDLLRDRGVYYKDVLVKSGCKARVEVVETLGESHVFHLLNPNSPNVEPFMDQVAAFLNSD